VYKGGFENDKYDGKYRDIEAEFAYLFSDNTKIEVDEDGGTLVTSSLATSPTVYVGSSKLSS